VSKGSKSGVNGNELMAGSNFGRYPPPPKIRFLKKKF